MLLDRTLVEVPRHLGRAEAPGPGSTPGICWSRGLGIGIMQEMTGLRLRNLLWVGNPGFPLKGSFKGDIDTDKLSYHNLDV